MMIKANELEVATDTYVELLTKFTGNSWNCFAEGVGRENVDVGALAIDFRQDRSAAQNHAVHQNYRRQEGGNFWGPTRSARLCHAVQGFSGIPALRA